MKTSKKLQQEDFNVEIGLDNPTNQSIEKEGLLKAFFEAHVAQRSMQRIIKNALLAVQYKNAN